jgi:hypothetical protein
MQATDLLIKTHSDIWYLTNDKVYKDWLHDANTILRKMQEQNTKKKKDIERELSKYFK